jgi:hypothetical protein
MVQRTDAGLCAYLIGATVNACGRSLVLPMS